MRKIVGILVLAVGVGGLGLWGSQNQADRVQGKLQKAAMAVGNNALHDVQVEVSGRDITISGIADTDAERGALLKALDQIDGRRLVRDDLTVLPLADPFSFAVTRTSGRSILQGNVPTEAMRAALAESGAEGADGLTLASGAPARWEMAIGSGLAALSKMDEGAVSAEGTALRISGIVDTPEERDALLAGLALPEGYSLTSDIETRDDGKPVDFTLSFDAASGAEVTGKLPAGLDIEQIATALGLSEVKGDAKAGRPGTPQAALAALAALTPWLVEFETAQLRQSGEAITVTGAVTPGADPRLIQSAMQDSFGASVRLDLSTLQSVPAPGTSRVNAVTGEAERFVNGYWLPDVAFTPSLDACGRQSDAVLARAKITFLSGSAQLGPRAIRAINAVAAVMRRCVQEAGLRAEIGGHTDTTGTGNYQLSADRAMVVREAMIARGVPGPALEAVGYGPSKPVADNATEAGRAANRRTTILWAR